MWELPILQDVEVTVLNRPLVWVKRRMRVDLNPSVRTSSTTPKNPLEKALLNTWEGMISRCYDKYDNSYKNYGAMGIFVQYRWRSAANFLEDVRRLPNWHNKEINVGKYQIDKDYYGSNCYGPDTCVWLHMSENAIYRTGVNPVCLVSPDGERTFHLTAQEAAEDRNVSEKQIRNMLAKKNTTLGRNGWTAHFIEGGEFVLRRAFVSEFPQPLLVNESSNRTYHV